MRRVSATLFLCSVLLLAAWRPAGAQEVPRLLQPTLITSCGQSPGPVQLKLFMDRLKLGYEYDLLATAELLKTRSGEGTAFKTLFIVTGASLKGMGAAGTNIDDEIARVQALITEAKRQGITVVGAHIEGMARRAQGAAPGDNSDELSIDAVCPVADLLLVKQEGNEDGRFTAIAAEMGIPLVEYEKNLELSDVLQRLFGG